MAKTTFSKFLNSNPNLSFHEADICASCVQNHTWQIYIRISRAMNWEANEAFLYAIEGSFSFSECNFGFLADNFAESEPKKDLCELADSDGWLRLEILDIDLVHENEIVCYFADEASCRVKAENVEIRVAEEDEIPVPFDWE